MDSMRNLVIEPVAFTDLSPIATLTELQSLSLVDSRTWYDPISNYEELANLTKLTELTISGQGYDLNNVGSLRFLSDLTNLRKLELTGNILHDLDGLQYLCNLEELNLTGSFPASWLSLELAELNYQHLAELTNIRTFIWLDAGDGSLDYLRSYDKLEVLALGDVFLHEQDEKNEIIGSLHSLRELYLSHITGFKVTSLSEYHNLERLVISYSDMPPSDFSFSSNLINLKEVVLWNTMRWWLADRSNSEKPDYDVFETLPALTKLHVYISDMDTPSLISNLSNLTQLTLSDSKIEDISYLTNLQKLEILDISNNGVTDIMPLSELPDLSEITTTYTDITCGNYQQFKETRPDVVIHTNRIC
jgi:Leucine-rich repeat (LRR) protein